MSLEHRKLHVVFFPLLAPGHINPMVDVVRLFAARDHVQASIVTTLVNAPNISKLLENCTMGVASTVGVHIIPFPSPETTGLPKGVENLAQVTCGDMSSKLLVSLKMLKDPLERFMEETRPDCLLVDYYYAFANEVAAKFDVPRLVFRGIGVFATCGEIAVRQYDPYNLPFPDDEPFIIPTLPHQVSFTKSRVPPPKPDKKSEIAQFFDGVVEAASKNYGEVFNSFYELEPDYVEYYREVLKRKSWQIGPVARRMNNAWTTEHKSLEWLDSKKPCSVIYVCFGSLTQFSSHQLNEIATALEQSGESFIWVVKKTKDNDDNEWWIDGFEERIEGRGLVLREWAPQVPILEHRATGGFVTHCGWNSILEGISAGVPMVTWPVFLDQFYNEKLVTNILKVGVQIGSVQWGYFGQGTFLTREKIAAALKAIMEGDEALEMRSRAEKLKDLAREVVEEESGSSYRDLSSLIQELRSR